MEFGGIVRTKIVAPQRRVGLLHRPRLVDFIHEHLNHKLILVSAAAGYGKTSLLVDFHQDTDVRSCWYSMDQADADSWSFVGHLAASVSSVFPQLESVALAGVGEQGQAAWDAGTVLRILVNEIQDRIPDYFAILIDDYQYADDSPEVRELLNWFLDHQPDNCCLIIASRTLPDLPYLELTAQQVIAALGTEDLAFTAEEIQDLLARNHELEIPPAEAEQLADQSEGWITGILLTTHSLWKGLLRTLTEAQGKDQPVFEYLAQEVYDRQPTAVRRFLRSTAILNSMRPEFCDALLGIADSKQMLEQLENANLFVSRLSGAEPAFRYHALFRDFLHRQFGPDGLEELRGIHRRAAQLLEAEGSLEEAIEHYLAAHAWSGAIQALYPIMEAAYRAGRLGNLARWIDALDPQALASDPALMVMRGRLHRQAGAFELALEGHATARRVYEQQGNLAGAAFAQVHQALVHRFMGDFDHAKSICDAVLESAKQVEIPADTLALAHRIIGESHHLTGRLPESKVAFRRSLRLYEQAGDRYQMAALHQALGTTAGRMGNPLEAEGHYERALELLQRLGNRWRAAEIRNNLGVGHYYQGEYDIALEILEQALVEAREVGHAHTEAAALASLADVRFELGQHRQARRLFDESLAKSRECSDAFLEVYSLCGLANLYRVDHAWEQAHSLLEQADQAVGESAPGYTEGLVQLYRGMVFLDEGRNGPAVESLSRAARLLEEAGAQRELAKTSLWHAKALFVDGKQQAAFEGLDSAMALCERIARPHLLVVDGSQMVPLIEQALAARGGQDARLSRLLARIQQFNLEMVSRPQAEVPRQVTPLRLEIRTFGSGQVLVDGRPIAHSAWGGPLVKELFFFLAERGQARRESILNVFWPEYSVAKAQGVFHATLYRMRRVVPRDAILYDHERVSYAFNQDLDRWYDAEAFEKLLREAGQAGERAGGLLHQAIEIYDGDYLPEVYADWCQARREELRGLYVDALIRLADAEREHGDHPGALLLYQRAIEAEPYREDARRGVMQSLADAGRRAEALRHFLSFAELLRSELEVRPAQETLELYESIRKSDPAVN